MDLQLGNVTTDTTCGARTAGAGMPDERPTTGSRASRLIAAMAMPLAAAAVCLAVYVATLAPTVTSEDSGELIAAAHCFGVPHPPGYPLWTMLCGVFVRVIAFGSIAWRANLFSAICAAASVGVMCRCLTLIGVGRAASFTAAIIVGFGAVVWSQSVITEVYTLHGLMFTLVLWALLKWHVSDRAGWLVVGSLFLGLGMCNHHTLGFSAVGLAAWVVLVKPRLLIRWRLALACLGVFLLALSPYLYLLISARAQPPMNWGHPDTTRDLIRHVNRDQYKGPGPSEDAPLAERLTEKLRQAAVIARYSIAEHTPYLAGIGAVGLAYLAFRRRRLALLVVALAAADVGLYLWLAGIGQSRQDIWAAKVFFVTQYLAAALPIAFGLQIIGSAIRSLLSKPLARGSMRRMSGLAEWVLVPLAIIPLCSHWGDNNYRHYWYAYDHGVNMLASMLPDAVVIPSGDHNTFPLVYLTMVEGMRPDVLIADKYGYIEPDLYRDMPGFEGRRPHTLEERKEIEEWIIRTAHRPVYYTVKKASLVGNAGLVPVGVVYHLLPEGKVLDVVSPWDAIRYRNETDGMPCARDYGADNIMADYVFFSALRALEEGDIAAGIERFERAAALGYGVKEIFNNIACALAEYGLIEEAITYYQRASALDKRYAASRWNLARLHKSRENWSAAEEIFLDLVDATPEDYRVFGELGFLGKLLDAPTPITLARFEESIRLNPAQPQIIFELANLHMDLQAPAEPTESEHRVEEPETPRVSESDFLLADIANPTVRDCPFAEVPSWDFGEVDPHAELTHTFVLHNPKSTPIAIIDSIRSCGCITPILDDTLFSPGSVHKVDVILQAGKRLRRIQHHVRLTTDASDCPVIELKVEARVVAADENENDAPGASKLTSDAPTKAEVAMTTACPPGIQIEDAESKSTPCPEEGAGTEQQPLVDADVPLNNAAGETTE